MTDQPQGIPSPFQPVPVNRMITPQTAMQIMNILKAPKLFIGVLYPEIDQMIKTLLDNLPPDTCTEEQPKEQV